jgi:hypothetical protein
VIRRRRTHAIPLADAPSFSGVARRTAVVRALLALLLVAALATGFVLARRLQADRTFLPPRTSGVVVLDVSSSISVDTYQRLAHTLRELAGTRRGYGLVLFSDVAYEALPPGTPSVELRPYIRYFAVPARGQGATLPPETPWSLAFAGGTRISSGLDLARRLLARDAIRDGSVLLISDLDNDREDSSRLTAAMLAYEEASIPLRVVGLNPAPDDAEYFRRLLGRAAAVTEARLPAEGEETAPASLAAAFPRWLFAAGGLLVLLLALNELWSGRLTWQASR